MLSTRAADRNGQITAISAAHFRNPLLEKLRDIAQKAMHAFVTLEKFDDRLIVTRERGESRLPVGIRETACIEDKVRITGDALAIREGLEENRHAPVATGPDALSNEFAKFM